MNNTNLLKSVAWFGTAFVVGVGAVALRLFTWRLTATRLMVDQINGQIDDYRALDESDGEAMESVRIISCATCEHSAVHGDEDGGADLRCFLNPPIPIRDGAEIFVEFPIVDASTFCQQWKGE